MRNGHIEIDRKYAITGNREEVVISLYDCETREERSQFFEAYDFEISDIIGLMQYYDISYRMKEWEDVNEYDNSIIYRCMIDTDSLRFCFENHQIIYVTKKFNVYDELMEKFNLKPLR